MVNLLVADKSFNWLICRRKVNKYNKWGFFGIFWSAKKMVQLTVNNFNV
jgi:hypothetical protein